MGESEKVKVLYVGHYNESSGWGQAARDYILALNKVGIDVVPRAINLGLSDFPVPNLIRKLEQKDLAGCNIIIQHVLPHYMVYDSCFKKNIGFFVVETKNIEHTKWIDNLNLMDELWVPCWEMTELKLKPPIHVVPHTCDITEFQRTYPALNIEKTKDKFVFYFIGQYNRRKHITAILRAFHNEFYPTEPVELVLKVNRYGMNPAELANEINGLTHGVKENLNLYQDIKRYKQELVITVNIPRDELLSLHATCDCFVCASFGEAFCLPAWDAMAMGNLVIAGNTGGPKDYIKPSYLVEGTYEPVFGERDCFDSFGSSRELEFHISILDLQRKMRMAYENNDPVVRNRNQINAQQYDYEMVGNQMKELIYA